MGRQISNIAIAVSLVSPKIAKNRKISSYFRFVILRSAALFLAIYSQTSITHAQDLFDKVGNYLGCQEDPSTSPYCTDPEIRAMVLEQFRFREKLGEAEFDVDKANLVGAQLSSTQNKLMMEAMFCGTDAECIKLSVEAATDKMYEISEINRPDPLTPGEIAALSAAERVMAAELPQQKERLRELDEDYAKEWNEAETIADQSELNMFRFRYKNPVAWARIWNRRCGDEAVCLEDKADSLERMVAARDAAIAKDQAARREEAQRKLRELRAEQAAKAAQARREAEERQREEMLEEMRATAPEEARERLSPDSLLYHVFFENFAEADRIASQIVRTEIYEKDYALIDRLVPQEFRGIASYNIMENRRILVIADYALTRLNNLGNCGEPVDLITWRKTEEQVFRNALGQERIIPAQYVRYHVPSKFARYARQTPLEGEGRLVREQVRSIGGCDSGLRIVLEDRLIEFADWHP